MAKVSPEYLRRQAEALQHYHGGRDRTAVAAQIGLSTDQYKRYLLGKTMLRPDLLSPLADAYGVTSLELASAIGIVAGAASIPAQTWDARAELRKLGLSDDEAEREMHSMGDWDEPARRNRVDRLRRERDQGARRGSDAPARDGKRDRRVG